MKYSIVTAVLYCTVLYLHQLLLAVPPQQVVVGEAACWLVAAHCVQQGREQRQRVAVGVRREHLKV